MLTDEKRLLITDVRHRLDDALANMEIKFFISCISGTESNAKKSGREQTIDKPVFRASISYFIVHGKKLNLNQIRQHFHNISKLEFEIKPLRSNAKFKDTEKKSTEEMIMSNHVKQIVKVRTRHLFFPWLFNSFFVDVKKSLKMF